MIGDIESSFGIARRMTVANAKRVEGVILALDLRPLNHPEPELEQDGDRLLPDLCEGMAVPEPRRKIWRRVAPARPMGTARPLAADAAQTSFGLGVMKSNGTSTLAASRLAEPTLRTRAAVVAWSGTASSSSGNG